MKIQKVAVALPSRRVTNDDVLAEIEKASPANPEAVKAARVVEIALKRIGTHTRYWLEDGESGLSVTIKACHEAMLSLQPDEEIDLLIYASVFSDVIEPAMANIVAHKIGLDGVECFDMKAACDGWMKAMRMADSYIKSGTYKRIMIVNAEFSMVKNFAIRPKLFNLTSVEALQWRLPCFTIGEAATATIVTADDTHSWVFKNTTRNELYDLCSVMAPHFEDTSPIASRRLAPDGPGWFTSWAAELSENGIPLAIDTYKKSGVEPGHVDILFTHASGTKDWRTIAKKLGLDNKLFDIHPRCGNLVSASVPAAMALAEKDGVLHRGQNIALLVASAGMTASCAHTMY